MTRIADPVAPTSPSLEPPPEGMLRRLLASLRFVYGAAVLTLIILVCLLSMPWTLRDGRSADPGIAAAPHPLFFDNQRLPLARQGPDLRYLSLWFGTDVLGRSLLGRCLLGGVISLGIGIAAAIIAVVLGVCVGLLAGYRGGWIDAFLMRLVDVLYGLPYILMIILFKIALEQPLKDWLAAHDYNPMAGNLIVLFLAIGLVSWLTMARVVRGQVLSLRAQPFIEACRASGLPQWRIFTRHLLPNLVGPITVYATLTVPQAILQESFLSFLGIGVQAPIPTWGVLASEGLLPALNGVNSHWWMLLFPCILLAVTLLSLNFVGDGLRDLFDPKREAAKI